MMPWLPLQQAAHVSPASGYLFELLRALFMLALVCALAFVALRWLARRGTLGTAVAGLDPGLQIRVLARVALEPRKALYVVQVGERRLLLASGESGPPSLLLELTAGATAGALHAATDGELAPARGDVSPVARGR